MKIKTVKLQNLLSKAIKGAGLNKLLPITQFVGIAAITENGTSLIKVVTTDAVNYLSLYDKITDELAEPFVVATDVEQFSKLVSKFTCEEVELTVNGSSLHVKGNGEYNIPLQFDENGAPVTFSDKVKETDWQVVAEIQPTVIKEILTSCKSSLAVTLEDPVCVNYWVGNKVIATDKSKIADLEKSILDVPVLVSSSVMELLALAGDEVIKVLTEPTNTYIGFDTPSMRVVGNIVEGVESYPVSSVEQFVNMTFDNSCKVNKNLLYSALDRILLFVTDLDNDGVQVNFTDTAIVLHSIDNSGVEKVPYVSVAGGTFTCTVPGSSLLEMIKGVATDTVELQYGDSNALKLVHEDVVQVLALM